MNWPELWMWLALLYLVLWHATKRFQWGGDTVLAFVIYTGAIADRMWGLFMAEVIVERTFVYIGEMKRLKEEAAKGEGLETLVFRLEHGDRAALNQVVNDFATVNELHPAYLFRRNTKLWHAILAFLLQVGAYFLIQEVRQPGYLRAFFIR